MTYFIIIFFLISKYEGLSHTEAVIPDMGFNYLSASTS